MKPKLLDLFCGGGGAAIGYTAAGFEVIGVDIKRQTNYPFGQIVADVMQLRPKDLAKFDVIHASPPCQGYSYGTTHHSPTFNPGHRGKDEPKLIAPVREMLEEAGKPYVIENVVGAMPEMNNPLLLCGTMFGLPIARHRLFETTLDLSPFDLPPHPHCKGIQLKYAHDNNIEPRHMSIAGKAMNAGHTALWKKLMGWPAVHPTSQRDLKEAIPPSYAEWIGKQFMEELS